MHPRSIEPARPTAWIAPNSVALDGPQRVVRFGPRRCCVDRSSGLTVWSEPGIVGVSGEVDLATVAAFRSALSRCDTDPGVYALDLSSVGFFSAAGVAALVEAGWVARPHPSVIASPSVRRVLDLCGLRFVLDRHGWCDARVD